jgi:Recombinase
MRPIQAELANLPSARQIAAELNRRGIKSATGGQWSSKTVTRLRERSTRKRKPKLSAFQRKEAMARRGNGETLAQIARSYAVSVSMISRL